MRTRLKNFQQVAVNARASRLAWEKSGLAPKTFEYGQRGDLILKVDIYRAPDAGDAVQPLIVFFHGGGWRIGHRRIVEAAFIAQVSRGYTLASVTYTLVPGATWPAQIEDVNTGLDWLTAKAGDLQVDTYRICLAGVSAGGQLALLAGLTRTDVKGVLAFYPPTDFNDMHDRGRIVRRNFGQLFGKPLEEAGDVMRAASPLTHVHAGAPPILVVHGTGDHFVDHAQSVRFVEALEAVGADASLLTLPGAVHADQRLNGPEAQPVIDAFFDRAIGCPGEAPAGQVG